MSRWWKWVVAPRIETAISDFEAEHERDPTEEERTAIEERVVADLQEAGEARADAARKGER
jgi:hypothetical protein